MFQASFVYRVRSYLKKQNQTLTATRDLLPECLGTVALQVEMTWGRGEGWAADLGDDSWERQDLGGTWKDGR